jgi:hypothetical protein
MRQAGFIECIRGTAELGSISRFSFRCPEDGDVNTPCLEREFLCAKW